MRTAGKHCAHTTLHWATDCDTQDARHDLALCLVGYQPLRNGGQAYTMPTSGLKQEPPNLKVSKRDKIQMHDSSCWCN